MPATLAILVNMMEDTVTLLATLVRGSKQEVRHLLIEWVDDPATTQLIQLSAGHEQRFPAGQRGGLLGVENGAPCGCAPLQQEELG